MALLLLHPVGLDSRCWQFLPNSPHEDWIEYDLLWHGGRPKPNIPLTLAAFADDVMSNTEGPVHIAGVSMGGAVAQHIALRHPERVLSLFISSAGPGGNGASQRQRAAAVQGCGIGSVLGETLERWFSPAALHGGHPAIAYVQRTLLGNNPEAFAASWLALADHDVRDRLAEIRVPTTVLHPAGDVAGSRQARAAMARELPNARFEVVEGPHMLHLERPQAFAAALLTHLEWCGASRASAR